MWPFKAKTQPKDEHPMQAEWDLFSEEEQVKAICIEPFLAYWRSLPSLHDVSYTFAWGAQVFQAQPGIEPPTGEGGITCIEEVSTVPKPRFDPKLISDEYR